MLRPDRRLMGPVLTEARDEQGEQLTGAMEQERRAGRGAVVSTAAENHLGAARVPRPRETRESFPLCFGCAMQLAG